MITSISKSVLAGAVAGFVAVAWMVPARADTFTVTTTCTNPYTGTQAGPTLFDVQVPSTVVVGQSVPVTVSFTFTNASGYNIDDVNNFSQTIFHAGPVPNPFTVTAGSLGAVPNGESRTVTQTGTWTPQAEGAATFTLGAASFDPLAYRSNDAISCTYACTPQSVSTVIVPLAAANPTPTETVGPDTHGDGRPGRPRRNDEPDAHPETVDPTPTVTVDPTPTVTVDPTPTETVDPTPTVTVGPTSTETVDPTPTETVRTRPPPRRWNPTPSDTPPRDTTRPTKQIVLFDATSPSLGRPRQPSPKSTSRATG